MNIEVQAISSYPESLVKEWEALLAQSRLPNPFFTPAWSKTWLNHFGRSLEARLVLFRSVEGKLQALGAFMEAKEIEGGSGLALLGSVDVWDYRDLIIAPWKNPAASTGPPLRVPSWAADGSMCTTQGMTRSSGG